MDISGFYSEQGNWSRSVAHHEPTYVFPPTLGSDPIKKKFCWKDWVPVIPLLSFDAQIADCGNGFKHADGDKGEIAANHLIISPSPQANTAVIKQQWL